MKNLVALAAAVAVAAVCPPVSGAHLPPAARALRAAVAAGRPLPARRQLDLARLTVRHADAALGFLRAHPRAGAPAARSRVWRDHLWLLRLGRRQERDAVARLRPAAVYVESFPAAVSIVGAHYGAGVAGWELACSSSEGGWGRWVPNTAGSGAGGWMQFMAGTFYGNVDWAFADARRRGLPVDPRARSWYSALGQAVVAGAMYYHHGNDGQWTGRRC